MLITSLSVPGKHLDCAPRPYGDIYNKLYNAYVIWTGAGMTLQVHTGVPCVFDFYTHAILLDLTPSLSLVSYFIKVLHISRVFKIEA